MNIYDCPRCGRDVHPCHDEAELRRRAQTDTYCAEALADLEFEATAKMVDDFAEALKAKLRTKHKERGTSWRHTDWQEECQQALANHAQKGDPRDVAAFAAFCWFHGWPTSKGAE